MGGHLRLLSNHTMVAISLVMTVLSILILGTQDVRGYYPAPTCSGPPWVCLRNRSPVIGRPLPVQFGARGGYPRPFYWNRKPYQTEYWRSGALLNRRSLMPHKPPIPYIPFLSKK